LTSQYQIHLITDTDIWQDLSRNTYNIFILVQCTLIHLENTYVVLVNSYSSTQAREEGLRGDRVLALQHARTALYLDIAAIIFGVVIWIVWIAAVAAS